LQQGYAAFAQSHQVPGYVRKAVWALRACRTAVLGGHVQRCPDGHFERVWYNSCRHRLCPQCAWLQVERWLDQQRARLLACDHYHVIFTMPSELHDLWQANVAVMTTLLFAGVRDTLLELLGDEAYLGAKPGIIATLHTWTQTLLLHPHVHCLLTGGGLTESGDWVAGAPRVFAAVPGGHGGLPGQAAGGRPAGGAAGAAAAPCGHAAAAL
jgi:Transposase zinc-binding domain/Putative transposase